MNINRPVRNLDSEDEISLTTDTGLTVGLIGLALNAVPNPYCKALGWGLMVWGADTAGKGLLQQIEEKKKREKEKEKRRYDEQSCSGTCGGKCKNCSSCRRRHGW